MKKSTLALSIAAAIGGIGMAGSAFAVNEALSGAESTSRFVRNDGGIGHTLLVPYFTTQNGNNTLLTITNTDTANGKLVKVRFRGASNSDDLYDFQVAMSPGDVWTAALSQDAASKQTKITTADASCTVPKTIDGLFSTARVDQGATDLAGQTREGYVEIFNMADIKPLIGSAANALYTSIKHVAGVAPCKTTYTPIETALGQDGTNAQLNALGLTAPTTGLTGDYIIINQTNAAAWSGSATALEVRTSAGAATTGNLVFWPQLNTAWGSGVVASTATADPLITSGIIATNNVDLPDLSTLYALNSSTGSISTAAGQADAIQSELNVKSVANQFTTDVSIGGQTDIVFTQPTRRYAVAVNYNAYVTADAFGVKSYYPYNDARAIIATGGAYTPAIVWRGAAKVSGTGNTNKNTVVTSTTGYVLGTAPITGAYGSKMKFGTGDNSKTLCLTSVATPTTGSIFDREEQTVATSTSTTTVGFVVSPQPTVASTTSYVYLCGEVAVISLNTNPTSGSLQSTWSASALGARVARYDVSYAAPLASTGWISFAADGETVGSGLPVIGGAFTRINNGNAYFGVSYPNKVTR